MSLWNKLPIELHEMIILNVDHLPDLLSFALTCHSACSRIIPGHLEFRHLCFIPGMADVWTQLSQSQFLGNVKRVQLVKPTFSTLRIPKSIMPSQDWAQLYKSEPEGINMNHVAMALKGMRNLQELGADGLFCPFPELLEVLSLLSPCHSLEVLHMFTLVSSVPDIFPTFQPISVTSLCLEFRNITPQKFIATLLRACHQLCDFILIAGPGGMDHLEFLLPCLKSIVSPHLTRFSLIFSGPTTRGSSSSPNIFSRFLKCHPKLINLLLLLPDKDKDLLQHVDHNICPRLNSLTFSKMPILTPSIVHQLVFLDVELDHSYFLTLKEMISLRFLIAGYSPKPDLCELLEAVPDMLECLCLETDVIYEPSTKDHEALYRLQKLTHLSNWFGLKFAEPECQEQLEELTSHLPNLTFVEVDNDVLQLEHNGQGGLDRFIKLSKDTSHASRCWGQHYWGGGYK